MKTNHITFSALMLLFAFAACNPIVTSEALDITDFSATLTGFVKLPSKLGDAEVGIMYDKWQSFESASVIFANVLDGNNKFTVTATGLEASTTYYYKSCVQNGRSIRYGAVKSFTTKEFTIPAGAVDLGVVMTREDGTTYKLYWAKSNLCENGLCANPEDYGDYYAWGETVPYYTEGHGQDSPCRSWRSRTYHPITGYNWVSYKFQTSGDSYDNVKFSKYNTKKSYGAVDHITELERGEKDWETMDDAARAKLGGRWRMPTNLEWMALQAQCTWTWTTQKDVYGILVTASNGNSIFLPAAGSQGGTSLFDAGFRGYYWSSSLNTESPNRAWDIDFYSDFVSSRGSDSRCNGQSVRPVVSE